MTLTRSSHTDPIHRRPSRAPRGDGLIVLILTILILAGCTSDPGQKVTLRTENFKFNQSELRVKSGQPVALTLVNKDGFAHAFDVDAFDIHIPMPASQTQTLTFTPDQPGAYQFYCGALGHPEAGMVGTLIVEP